MTGATCKEDSYYFIRKGVLGGGAFTGFLVELELVKIILHSSHAGRDGPPLHQRV